MATSPSAFEDYVKVIYAHTEWQPTPITSSVLAARLGLAASSVTEMVKKLVARGLALHEPYSAIELTPAGEELALRTLRKHRLIETWLVDQLGYRWDEVHDEAEVLEHAISDRLLDALDDRLGNPVRDPHGDPIPSRHGIIKRPDATCLADLPPGVRGTVVRISDRDPSVLRYLEAEGVVLDAVVTVMTSDTVEHNGALLQLAPEALTAIWVSPVV